MTDGRVSEMAPARRLPRPALRFIVIALGCGVLLLWIRREAFGGAVLAYLLEPTHAFDDARIPPPPDYADPENWAALPNRSDGADFTPPGTHDNQHDALIDVFYIHPTTFRQRHNWNQPPADAKANTITDDVVLPAQASVFNGRCRVFAPRYRQATLYAFFDIEENGAQALDVAYADIERAFAHFLVHFSQGRPFILAGHSQGSRHLELLLKRRISNSPLRDRMIAAYPIGFPISVEEMRQGAPDIPLCASPEQTQCYVTWNAVGPRATSRRDTGDDACVNPLTWRTDGSAAAHGLNLGSLSTRPEVAMEIGVADAQCLDGQLVVTELRSERFDLPIYFGIDSYHVLDYNLFYVNLRENIDTRIQAFLAGT